MRRDGAGYAGPRLDDPAAGRPSRAARIEARLARADPAYRLALLRALLALDLEGGIFPDGPGDTPPGSAVANDSPGFDSAGFDSAGFGPEEATSRPFAAGSGDDSGAPGAAKPADVGVRAGRFRRVARHAAGGLGVVYVADDAEFDRRVALKEIRPERADDPISRAHFVREARITSRLEHPGIISVYGCGRYPDGRPYYAMRLVEGPTLLEAIHAYHRARKGGEPGGDVLALRGLLRHFVDVCNAVAFAHSRGVIHRDLKPGNVKLGPFGETILLDWGLAKAMGEEEPPAPAGGPMGAGMPYPTLEGEVRGTPTFMAPEQAIGDVARVGPASDIYGLGATLFFLLDGRAPGPAARGAGPGAGVPAALASICCRAMAPDPADRYGSALALAGDVERWLADEPVSTHRESRLARLGRWGRKHQPAVAGAVALLATATVGLALGGWLVGRERDKALAQKERAVAERAQKEQALRVALDYGQSGTGAITEFLQVVQQELPYLNDPKTEKVRLALSQIAAKYVRQFEVHPILGREARILLGDTLREVARLHLQAHDLGEARRLLDEAVRLLATLPPPDDRHPTVRNALAFYHLELGGVACLRDRPEDAEDAFAEALRLCRANRDAEPDTPAYRETQAFNLLALASVEHELGDHDGSIRRFVEAFGLLERLEESLGPNLNVEFSLINGLVGVAEPLVARGRIGEAEGRLRQAEGRLATYLPGNEANVDLRNLQAQIRAGQSAARAGAGDRPAATRLAGEAIDAWGRLAVERPDLLQYKSALAGTLIDRGNLLDGSGDAAGARRDYDLALEKFYEILRRAPQSIRNYGERARALAGLAELDLKEGRVEAARPRLDQAGRDLRISLEANPAATRHRATARLLDRLRAEAAARP